jgi:hypothetical protein
MINIAIIRNYCQAKHKYDILIIVQDNFFTRIHNKFGIK